MPKNPVPAPETVTISVTVPRMFAVKLRKDTAATVTRDLSKIDSKAALHIFKYGLGRFNRDGASPSDVVKEGDSERKRTAEEMTTEAIRLSDDKWDRLCTGRLREHTGGASDPVLVELRTLCVKALVKRGVARKAIPKLSDRAAIKAQLAAFDGLYEKAVAMAERVVAARNATDL